MQQYWASVDAAELPGQIEAKATAFYQDINSDGRLKLWQKAYNSYYGLDQKGRHVSAEPGHDGAQGELIRVKASHVRNLAQHLLNLTTQSRASFEARSLNSDFKSQASCILGQQVLEYYMRERKLEQIFRLAAEYSVVFAEGYVVADWDSERGEDFASDPATGRMVKSGDIDLRVFLPIDVIREYYQDEDNKPDWYVTRRYVSKFKLAAMYPDRAEEILSLPSVRLGAGIDDLSTFNSHGDSDRVVVYYLYHDKCPQLPTGRRSVIAGDLAIEDGPFPFKKFNVQRITPGVQVKSPYGYSSTFDLLGLNDVIDMVLSSVTTNNNNFALQKIWTPPGAQIKVTDLGVGGVHIESVHKPEPLQLTQSAPESYNLLKYYDTLCELISGVNSVARGNPEGGLKGASGSALALLQSMTIQFASGLQQSFSQLVEGVGDSIIDILQVKAAIPRLATIAGKNNRSYSKKFSGQDLEPITRITVDMGNPAARTAAGRLQIADNLLQQGLIKRPEQYLEVLATGKLEPMVESEQSELLLIKSENEDLKDGQQVQAVLIEDHVLHVKEHKAILSDPETKRQPDIVQNVLSHIQEHIDLWKTMPPELLALLGMQPPPMPMMPPPQEAGAPPMPGEEMPGPQPDMPVEAEAGGMPAMPTNPMTGEQAPVPAGAM